MSLKQYALTMLDHGICVMPPQDDGTKRPFGKWKEYQYRLPTAKEVSTWYANGKASIGLLTGRVSGGIDGALECLDFDDRAIYAQFCQKASEIKLGALLDKIEQGYCEDSPNGVHLLYYCAAISGNTKLATNSAGKATIETRGEGGFVVTAPTIWPGKQYRIVSGSITTIATITPVERQQLFDLAATFSEAEPSKQEPRIHTASKDSRPGDDYASRTTWYEILQPLGWQLLYERHHTAYWIKPGSTSKTHHVTTNHNNSDLLYSFSTSTPFTSERGYSKFSAYAILYHRGDFEAAGRELARQGYGTDAEIPKWAQEPTPQAENNEPWKSFAWVAQAEFEPIRWIVPDLIPEGCTILAGSPKIGKSWMATELCLCAASGGKRPFLNHYKLPDIGALYLALEDSDRRLNDRINKLVGQLPQWSPHHAPAPSNVHYATEWPILGQGCTEKLTEYLDAYPGTKLVIIDTLQKVRPPAGANMTAYEMDYKVISAFQQIAIHRHIAVVILHHLRKSSGALNEDPFEQVSGSMGLSGAADSTIVLHKGKSTNLAELYVRGRDVEEQTITIRLDDGCWQYMGTGMESEGRKYLVEIKEYVQEKKLTYFKPSEFNRWYRDNNGAEIKCVRNVFQRLYQDGHLAKWDAGKYSLPGVKDRSGA